MVLHLLNALQRLRVKAGGATETRRVSFRALGVEQIGHVYEGLLDHTAVRAAEPVLGLRGTRHKEPEIPLGRLEALRAQGQDKLVEFLKDETGRSVAALKRALESDVLLDGHPLRRACGQDEALWARVRPFAGLLREDSFERPLVVLPGSVYVTAGTARRSTGTHYTPPSLTEPVVKHTLDPLVYEGPALGWPEDEWRLKSPKEILELKVCDMAMGSGAFLVQACRYLAEKLVEAWEIYEERGARSGIQEAKGELMRIQSYRDLEVWKLAMDLAEQSYRVTKTFPKDELFGMVSQIRRAAASVPANIAEGNARQSTKEFLNFLSIARGSLHELETHLLLSQRVGLTSVETIQPMLEMSERISQMLARLRQSLERKL